MNTAPDPGAELARLAQEVASARDVARAGGAIDLSHLEKRVVQVCDEVARAAMAGGEAGTRERLANEMRALIDGLDALAGEIATQHKVLVARLKSLETLPGAGAASGPGAENG